MLKKEADKLKKEQAKLANQFTEVPIEQNQVWYLSDAVAITLFMFVIMLFFV